MSLPAFIISLGIILVLLWRASYYRRQRETLRKDYQRLRSEAQNLQKEYTTALILRDGILSVIEDGLLVLNERGIICFANQSAQLLFERPLLDQTLMMAVRHFELDNLVRTARQQPFEIIEKTLAMHNHLVQVRVLQVERYSLIVLKDVTVLQQLSRARRDMIANISHELNTPITTIGLLADTLLGGAGEKPDIRDKMLRNIRAENETLRQLVQEMRDLALIESRQMPIKMIETALLPLVQKTVFPLMTLAEQKSLTIHIEVPDDLHVLADENQISRALKNIVHNAIKFTSVGGTIRVSAEITGQEVVLQVEDNGPGISPKMIDRIFERFFQGDPSRQQGTGLGLAIARHIVLGHGGNLWVKNNPTYGCTFYFSLPLAEASPQVTSF